MLMLQLKERTAISHSSKNWRVASDSPGTPYKFSSAPQTYSHSGQGHFTSNVKDLIEFAEVHLNILKSTAFPFLLEISSCNHIPDLQPHPLLAPANNQNVYNYRSPILRGVALCKSV